MSRRSEPPLRFCDHHRQRYAEEVPIPAAGEFLIGDHTDEGTIGDDGEFRVTLVELAGDRSGWLYPHLEVYGEAVPALRRAIDAGLLEVLAPVGDSDEFSGRLIALGFTDRSDRPLSRRVRRGGRGDDPNPHPERADDQEQQAVESQDDPPNAHAPNVRSPASAAPV